MNIIVYDTFNEYVASTSYKKDDLCFIKELGAWYQGGKVKDGHMPYDDCHHHDCHHDCHHHDHCHDHHMELSVINIDGVAYWAWKGCLVKDNEGNFVKVYKPQDAPTIDVDAIVSQVLVEVNKLLGNYVTKSYVDNLVSGLVTKSYVDNLVSGLVTKSYVDAELAKKQPLLSCNDFNTLTIGSKVYNPFGMCGENVTITEEDIPGGGGGNEPGFDPNDPNDPNNPFARTVTWKAGTGCIGSYNKNYLLGDTVSATVGNPYVTAASGYENPVWDKSSIVVSADGDNSFTRTATKKPEEPVETSYKIYAAPIAYNSVDPTSLPSDAVSCESLTTNFSGKSITVERVPNTRTRMIMFVPDSVNIINVTETHQDGIVNPFNEIFSIKDSNKTISVNGVTYKVCYVYNDTKYYSIGAASEINNVTFKFN